MKVQHIAIEGKCFFINTDMIIRRSSYPSDLCERNIVSELPEFVEESNLLVLNKLERLLTVCKVKNIDDIDLSKEFYFIGKTDEEISLVCETNDVPENTIEREDGWRGFRIQGILDFSLIGILSKLSGILADNKIGIFAVSTFNTDYILVKDADFEKSLAVLLNAGYTVI